MEIHDSAYDKVEFALMISTNPLGGMFTISRPACLIFFFFFF